MKSWPIMIDQQSDNLTYEYLTKDRISSNSICGFNLWNIKLALPFLLSDLHSNIRYQKTIYKYNNQSKNMSVASIYVWFESWGERMVGYFQVQKAAKIAQSSWFSDSISNKDLSVPFISGCWSIFEWHFQVSTESDYFEPCSFFILENECSTLNCQNLEAGFWTQ